MNILVLGGTRFMGRHLVEALLADGHDVTIANRGLTGDNFGDRVARICVERTDPISIQNQIPKVVYDVVYDSIAYCSNDIKYLLDHVRCKRYIQISTISVYDSLHLDTKEEEFDPSTKELVYCNREDFLYDEIKRQAECAIVQDYGTIPAVRVRFTFVIGPDDYTKRLRFYVEHIMKQIPMFIDNLDSSLSFVRSSEAGGFLAHLAKSTFTGAINASNEQTISIAEIASYVEMKSKKSLLLSEQGDVAPYNRATAFSINCDKSKIIGYTFTPLNTWIYELLDEFIQDFSPTSS